ncbi:MAG: hypothetical protein JW833_10880 [Prolixibacteraceae bacterium]|nr:hypothetical protein [Prolixibacteraceae bacterium]
MKIRFLYFLMVLLISFSCDYEFPETDISDNYSLGSLSFEKFIATGDDFSAGVMNGALYSLGQKNSIPAIIAGQVNKIGEISFNQPDIDAENGRNYYVEQNPEIYGRWEYIYTDKITENPIIRLTSGNNVGSFSGDISSINNFSVPFLKTPQLFESGLSSNPYYERISSGIGNNTLAGDIENRGTTFFYAWLGMNDVLNYAVNGAVSNEETGFGEIKLTGVNEFKSGFDSFIDALMADPDCKGVIGNIISLSDLPYFYIKPYNFLLLENNKIAAAKAALDLSKFNAGIIQYNRTAADEDKRPLIGFEDNGITNLYPQALIIEDETLPEAFYSDGTPIPKYRQLVEGEMALFSITDELVNLGYGYKIALPSKYILTLKEIKEVEAAIQNYNEVILNKVEQYSGRLALADIAGKVHEIAITGTYDAWGQVKNDTVYYANGIPIEGSLGLNGIFSLDALHFNCRGNALVANTFIDVINKEFSVFIPKTDINNYQGNVFTVLY